MFAGSQLNKQLFQIYLFHLFDLAMLILTFLQEFSTLVEENDALQRKIEVWMFAELSRTECAVLYIMCILCAWMYHVFVCWWTTSCTCVYTCIEPGGRVSSTEQDPHGGTREGKWWERRQGLVLHVHVHVHEYADCAILFKWSLFRVYVVFIFFISSFLTNMHTGLQWEGAANLWPWQAKEACCRWFLGGGYGFRWW